MSDRHESAFINAAQWLSALALVFAGYVLWETFGYVQPPITQLSGDYSAIKTTDGTIVVSFRCASVVHRDFEMHVHREAVHEPTGLTVVLPITESAFTRGSRAVYRQFYMPAPVPSGKWCVTTRAEWRPTWALRDRSVDAVTKCFEVK